MAQRQEVKTLLKQLKEAEALGDESMVKRILDQIAHITHRNVDEPEEKEQIVIMYKTVPGRSFHVPPPVSKRAALTADFKKVVASRG